MVIFWSKLQTNHIQFLDKNKIKMCLTTFGRKTVEIKSTNINHLQFNILTEVFLDKVCFYGKCLHSINTIIFGKEKRVWAL